VQSTLSLTPLHRRHAGRPLDEAGEHALVAARADPYGAFGGLVASYPQIDPSGQLATSW